MTDRTYLKTKYHSKEKKDLIFDRRNSSFLSPVKILRQVIGRQNRGLISVLRQSQPPQPQKLPPKLSRSQIGKLSDSVASRRVQLLVTSSAPQVSLKHHKSIIMLPLRGIGFLELPLEEREMMLLAQKMRAHRRFILAVNHLPD